MPFIPFALGGYKIEPEYNGGSFQDRTEFFVLRPFIEGYVFKPWIRFNTTPQIVPAERDPVPRLGGYRRVFLEQPRQGGDPDGAHQLGESRGYISQAPAPFRLSFTVQGYYGLVLKLRYGIADQQTPGQTALGSVSLPIQAGRSQVLTLQLNLAF